MQNVILCWASLASFVLDDRLQHAVTNDETAIAGRIARLEAQRGDGRANAKRATQGREGLGPDQRRVGEGDKDIVMLPRDRLAGCEHGMGRAVALDLHHDAGGRQHSRDLGCDIGAIGTDHDHDLVGSGPRDGGERMPQHRAAGDLMQHLGPARLYARAFAGRQDDGQAGPAGLHFRHDCRFPCSPRLAGGCRSHAWSPCGDSR